MPAEYVRTHGRKFDEIMSRDLVWATADTRLDSLVGIVSRADYVARSRARSTKEPLRPAGDGGEHVLAELAKPVRAPREGLTIAVRDEVTDRNGVIFDEKEHEALRAAAENAPGVKAVDDHLVWVEPVSGTIIDAPQQKRTATKPVSTSVCGETELGFILRCLRGGHQALRSISTRRRRPARRPST
jgi:hypothetical protein